MVNKIKKKKWKEKELAGLLRCPAKEVDKWLKDNKDDNKSKYKDEHRDGLYILADEITCAMKLLYCQTVPAKKLSNQRHKLVLLHFDDELISQNKSNLKECYFCGFSGITTSTIIFKCNNKKCSFYKKLCCIKCKHKYVDIYMGSMQN
eukprot:545903_1